MTVDLVDYFDALKCGNLATPNQIGNVASGVGIRTTTWRSANEAAEERGTIMGPSPRVRIVLAARGRGHLAACNDARTPQNGDKPAAETTTARRAAQGDRARTGNDGLSVDARSPWERLGRGVVVSAAGLSPFCGVRASLQAARMAAAGPRARCVTRGSGPMIVASLLCALIGRSPCCRTDSDPLATLPTGRRSRGSRTSGRSK